MGGVGGRQARRILGIDLGDRRIGVALADLEHGSAVPIATLGRAKWVAEDAKVLARMATEHQAEALVVGLPLDMSGTEGLQAIRTREWATAVAAATGLPLRFRDERLTSVRAERLIGPPARGRSGGPPTAAQRESRRARVDREAAALILQDEIDATATGPAVETLANDPEPSRGEA